MEKLGGFLIWLFELPYLGGFLAVVVTLWYAFVLNNPDWLGEIYPD